MKVGDGLPCGRPVIDADVVGIGFEFLFNTSFGLIQQPKQVNTFICGQVEE
jgi:hypothetical protein